MDTIFFQIRFSDNNKNTTLFINDEFVANVSFIEHDREKGNMKIKMTNHASGQAYIEKIIKTDNVDFIGMDFTRMFIDVYTTSEEIDRLKN